MQEKFCVTCGENVILDDMVSLEGHTVVHFHQSLQYPVEDVEFCTGPFIPPMPEFDQDDVNADFWDALSDEQPELFPDWDLQDEPSPEELEEMDRNAYDLLSDLGE
jgi:hypothetical protein